MMDQEKFLLFMYENPMDRAAGLLVSVLVMPPRVPNAPSLRRVFHAAYTTIAGEMAQQQQQQMARGQEMYTGGGAPVSVGANKTVMTVRRGRLAMYVVCLC